MKCFQLLQKESNFVSSRKQLHFPSNYKLHSISNSAFNQIRDYNGTCKTKKFRQIQAYSHIFWQIRAYSGIFRHSGIIRHIQDLFRHIQAYSGSSVNLAYSEPWHIKNYRHIQNPGIFRFLVYSQPWYSENQRHIENPGIY